jgi:hypothetical protein
MYLEHVMPLNGLFIGWVAETASLYDLVDLSWYVVYVDN